LASYNPSARQTIRAFEVPANLCNRTYRYVKDCERRSIDIDEMKLEEFANAFADKGRLLSFAMNMLNTNQLQRLLSKIA